MRTEMALFRCLAVRSALCHLRKIWGCGIKLLCFAFENLSSAYVHFIYILCLKHVESET